MDPMAELFEAGHLHKIVGVRPGTTGNKLKEACQRARLRHHPDKGGATELFNIVEAIVQLCLNNLPSCGENTPVHLRALHMQIDNERSVFDRGRGDVKQLQRLRENYKRHFHAHQQHLEEVEARRVREQLQRERRVREARELQEYIDRVDKIYETNALI